MKLEKFTAGDFETLISWIESSKTLLQWAGPLLKWPLDTKQLEEYIKPSELDPPKRLIYKAVDKDNQTCGHIELNVNYENESATVCRVFITEGYRNKGHGAKMLKQILDIGFNKLSLRRIDLDVFTYNTSAIKCYEKVGFIKEGVKRKYTKYKDEYWDLMGMSILKEESLSLKQLNF